MRIRAAALLLLGWAACGLPPGNLDLRDPAVCAGCHPDHYRQWRASMHAYSDRGPLFTAMLARGVREGGRAIGEGCVRCHAPLAVFDQVTTDGTNLSSLPEAERGVTCFFCHAMTDPHAPVLVEDGALRGGIADPVPTRAHGSVYSTLHDCNTTDSSAQCSSCHVDTMWEWKTSIYSLREAPQVYLSCGKCHMAGTRGRAAQSGDAPTRLVHDHASPGIDVALSEWPGRAEQLSAIQRELDSSVATRLCVMPQDGGVRLQVSLDNIAAGHKFPTGVPRQRATWVEIVATAGDRVVFESGRVADGEPALATGGWVMRERLLDAGGRDLLMPWEVGAQVVSNLLGPPVTTDPQNLLYYHAVRREFTVADTPDRVTLRVRVRPTDFDILRELERSGDLAPSASAMMPTFTLAGGTLEWSRARGYGCVP